MATSTNLGLYLPTREDYISVKRDLSDNYEIIDAAVGGNTQGIAQIQSETDIVINGATSTSNVTIGQFVTVRNSSITGIVDGVYKALANVTAGTSFVAANLQAVTGGALNKIVSDTNAMIQQQENDMDIVVRGNTASVNVTAGQFVTVRDSTIANISDGIYKAANNVSSGVPFTDADLNNISSGALNELVSDLATINDHIVWQFSTEVAGATAVEYPSTAREIFIRVFISSANRYMTMQTPVGAIPSETVKYQLAEQPAVGSKVYIEVNPSTRKVKLDTVTFSDGTSYLSTSKLLVGYR